MYPTTAEEVILKALVRYHYMTVDQLMLATGQTSLRGARLRLHHLTDEGYLWRIHRRTTEQNLPLKPAYTISARTKKYLEEQGTIVLPPRLGYFDSIGFFVGGTGGQTSRDWRGRE